MRGFCVIISPKFQSEFQSKFRARLVIMVKVPRAGRVKTRLGRDIGMTASAWWFRHQVTRLLRQLADPRWQIILSVAPDVEGLQSRVWPKQFVRMPQGSGDLGQRMARIFSQAPMGPVVVVGGDIPGIKRKHIADAFNQLGRSQAVFGPATDGGYWLVGLQRNRPLPIGLFENVRWSSPHALADSIATMAPLSPTMVAILQDIDTADDLAAHQALQLSSL